MSEKNIADSNEGASQLRIKASVGQTLRVNSSYSGIPRGAVGTTDGYRGAVSKAIRSAEYGVAHHLAVEAAGGSLSAASNLGGVASLVQAMAQATIDAMDQRRQDAFARAATKAAEDLKPGESAQFFAGDYDYYAGFGWVRVVPENQESIGPSDAMKAIIDRAEPSLSLEMLTKLRAPIWPTADGTRQP
jgi:hypothetical protein